MMVDLNSPDRRDTAGCRGSSGIACRWCARSPDWPGTAGWPRIHCSRWDSSENLSM